jgi:hypothetical protein
MEKCRQPHDTATLMSGQRILVVILLTKMGPTHSPETSLTNQMTMRYNLEGTDLIENYFSVDFMLFKLLSHQTHIICMVYGHREIFMPIPLAIPSQLKEVLSFRGYDFCVIHSFTYYKLSPLICLLYAGFGLLYPAHKQTL